MIIIAITHIRRRNLFFLACKHKPCQRQNRTAQEAKEHPSKRDKKRRFLYNFWIFGLEHSHASHTRSTLPLNSEALDWGANPGRSPSGTHFRVPGSPPPTTTLLPSLFSAMDSDHLDTMADSRKLIKKIMTKEVGNALLWTSFLKKIVYCAMTQAKKVR